MQTLIYISIGVVIGYFGFKILKGGGEKKITHPNFSAEKLDGGQDRKEKRGDINKNILNLLDEKGKVRNNDIEELLGVADSTATKYLQRLEDEGKIKQVGSTGSSVYYIKK